MIIAKMGLSQMWLNVSSRVSRTRNTYRVRAGVKKDHSDRGSSTIAYDRHIIAYGH